MLFIESLAAQMTYLNHVSEIMNNSDDEIERSKASRGYAFIFPTGIINAIETTKLREYLLNYSMDKIEKLRK